MPQSFQVGLLQHDPTVGDVAGNLDRLERQFDAAAQSGADLVVTPELAVLGYPPRDLLHRNGVLAEQEAALQRLATLTEDGPAMIVGAATESPAQSGPPLQNSAVVFADGERRDRYAKRLLPTYDIFDEHRYFDPGTEPLTVDVDGVTVGVSICEDAWHDASITGKRRHGTNPLAELEAAGAELIVTLSASPFRLGKPQSRVTRFGAHAKDTGLPVVFANQVGGNDDIIFDGNSLVLDREGDVLERLPAFEEAVRTVDPFGEIPVGSVSMRESRAGQARQALRLGLRDYMAKTGFSDVIIGMSGGVDSTVATVLAVDALGPDHVYGVSLPSTITSDQSIEDARAVADALGIEFDVVPVGGAIETLEASIESATGEVVDGLAAENIQARARGVVLMTLANARNAFVLTPDNKSEAAVGYCTLYGDAVGALAPLGDCYKTLVYDLADHYNDDPPVGSEPVIPERVIEKPPTAELREGQTDEDELPPYDQLDPVLKSYIHGQVTGADLRAEFPDHVVDEALSRIARSEFKRWQTPPPLRITGKSFDRGWKYPIAASYEAVLERGEETMSAETD
ncbi:NAD+ synthase [Halovenus sp. WSH3]|uniref:Glutamine-dependent NAD(+) synthetase n=2 Tax=Halovenus carboxidivorans TaxID=2692199 RepID=A0A6B0TBH0_9EURY|nr:NAD+ synthase [Halovenus carboxidivorans]